MLIYIYNIYRIQLYVFHICDWMKQRFLLLIQISDDRCSWVYKIKNNKRKGWIILKTKPQIYEGRDKYLKDKRRKIRNKDGKKKWKQKIERKKVK